MSDAPEIPPLLDERTLAALREDFASTGDLEQLAALIGNFVARAAEQVEGIAAAAGAGDRETIRTSAHKLKGGSQTLGASQLGAVAARIEVLAERSDVAGAARAVPELETVFARTRDALSQAVGAIAEDPDARS